MPAQWGVVYYHAPSHELRGWAVDLRDPQSAPVLRVDTGQGQGQIVANRPNALLAEAGLSAATGGFQVRLPGSFPKVSVFFQGQDGAELVGSPLAALGRVPDFENTPSSRGIDTPSAQAGARPPLGPVVVLIPVFKGYQATLECVHSVLQAQALNRCVHTVVVIDDAGPDARLTQALQALAAKGCIQYTRHASNLGFIRTMNRGMARFAGHDVVWLNADTRVQGNWLDRLQQGAYAQPHTASATPFSNNGELMGFPQPRVAAAMPSAQAQARLDACAAAVGAEPVPLLVGCGFCFYVKRAALDAVGLLDEDHLQRGYGEETDWCLRAQQHGWQHVGVPSVFVAHAGGASFGPEKALRVAQNNAVVRARYPRAERDYQAFVARDPLTPARDALTQALRAQGLNAHGEPCAKQVATPALAPARAIRLKKYPPVTAPCTAWLMLDTTLTPELGERWLQLIRLIRGQTTVLPDQDQDQGSDHGYAEAGYAADGADGAVKGQTTLMPIRGLTPFVPFVNCGLTPLFPFVFTLKAGVWDTQWQATGRVFRLPGLLDLPLSERVRACGVQAVVSLAPAPDNDVLAHAQATELPVYAPDTAAWRAVGARPLSALPGFPELHHNE